MAETKYNLIEVILRGGPRDGLVIKLPPHTTTVDIPDIEPAAPYAELITSDTKKRHSWDGDALTISYDRYHRTDKTDGERVIFRHLPEIVQVQDVV